MRPGTKEWLIDAEARYGGYVTNVPRSKVSDLDPRSPQEIASGGMTGGDRMSDEHNGYARYYEEALRPFLDRPVVLAEIGILTGVGLAIWSELFPTGQVIGLDIDLGHVRKNIPDLKARGAFQADNVELHEFDQLKKTPNVLPDILRGRRIDILIDDGFHRDDAVLNTLELVEPHLSPDFVYIIEDNERVHCAIHWRYRHLDVWNEGNLTILRPRRAGTSSLSWLYGAARRVTLYQAKRVRRRIKRSLGRG